MFFFHFFITPTFSFVFYVFTSCPDLLLAVGDSEYMRTMKRTVILTIDDCLLKTSIFKEELPQVDAQFSFKKLKVYVSFRSYLSEFLHSLKKYYEVVAWTSS